MRAIILLLSMLCFALPASAQFMVGTVSATCDSSKTGALRLNSGALEYCNGTAWTSTGGTSQWTTGSGLIYYNGGNVGIGTTVANSSLELGGGIKIANDSATCVTGKAGTIRYSGGSPPWQYCDGNTWQNFKQPRCLTVGTGECYLDATRSNDDADFIASNIKDSVDILGVTGTYTGGGGSYSIVNGAHTAADCTNAGGSITPHAGIYFCSFLAASCPGGWASYADLVLTYPAKCAVTTASCNCTPPAHPSTWDTSIGTCTYYTVYSNGCRTPATCTAPTTAVACY